MTKVICGFSAIGKTYVAETRPRILDVQSTFEPDGLEQVMMQVSQAYRSNEYDYILLTPNIKVVSALRNHRIPFVCVYPSIGQSKAYQSRMWDQGKTDEEVESLIRDWCSLIADFAEYSQTRIVLKDGEYLSDVLDRI